MADVAGVGRGRRLEDFSDAEVAEMKSSETTAQVMTKAQVDAHFSDLHPVVRGDDPTFDELRASYGATLPTKLALAVDAAGKACELGEMFGVAGLAAPNMLLGYGGLAFGAGVSLYELDLENARGHELNENAVKSQLHVAMVAVLDLPEGFRAEQFAKNATVTDRDWHSGSLEIATQLMLPQHSAQRDVLQLHADQGMNAARAMIDARIPDSKAYIEHDAGLKARYAADPAFKAGFDAAVWARDRNDGSFGQLVDGLEARDARYARQNIEIRA